jgi:hypothetical protein
VEILTGERDAGDSVRHRWSKRDGSRLQSVRTSG